MGFKKSETERKKEHKDFSGYDKTMRKIVVRNTGDKDQSKVVEKWEEKNPLGSSGKPLEVRLYWDSDDQKYKAQKRNSMEQNWKTFAESEERKIGHKKAMGRVKKWGSHLKQLWDEKFVKDAKKMDWVS